jgi:hypothetical protein
MHGRVEMHTQFWSDNLKRRDLSDDLGVDGRIILKCILEKQGVWLRNGINWLRTETSGRLL